MLKNNIHNRIDDILIEMIEDADEVTQGLGPYIHRAMLIHLDYILLY